MAAPAHHALHGRFQGHVSGEGLPDTLFLLNSDATAVPGRFLVGSFGADYYNIEGL